MLLKLVRRPADLYGDRCPTPSGESNELLEREPFEVAASEMRYASRVAADELYSHCLAPPFEVSDEASGELTFELGDGVRLSLG